MRGGVTALARGARGVSRVLTGILCGALFTGCFYVSNQEFEDAWDRDGDRWPLGEEGDPDADCAPFDPAIHPFAADPRGDGCDSDCGRELDTDDDDFPDDADCAPNDPTIYPCAPDTDGDDIDSDCDGFDGPREDACLGIDPSFPDAEPIPLEDCPEDLRTAGNGEGA